MMAEQMTVETVYRDSLAVDMGRFAKKYRKGDDSPASQIASSIAASAWVITNSINTFELFAEDGCLTDALRRGIREALFGDLAADEADIRDVASKISFDVDSLSHAICMGIRHGIFGNGAAESSDPDIRRMDVAVSSTES